MKRKIYYGEQTKKALDNFKISGQKVNLRLIYALINVKKASVKANYKLNQISSSKYQAILKASDEILTGKYDEQFVLDSVQGGAGTSINMNVNEVISARATEIMKGEKVHYLDDVNMSQSTNDVLPTAFRLYSLILLDEYLSELNNLKIIFQKKRREFKNVVKVGRTHLQDAVPITLGQEFGAYASFVERDLRRLKEMQKYLLETNLGGTAIGTGINAPIGFSRLAHNELFKLTGFKFKPARDLIDSTQNLDVFMHLSSLLSVSAVNLSKICSDLRLLASGPKAGFSEIDIPMSQYGSSIMPNKNNPVFLECFSQVSYLVSGNAQGVEMAVSSGTLELNVMLPLIIKNITDSFTALIGSTNALVKNINELVANKDRCRELLEKSFVTATALNKRIGYDETRKLIRESFENGETLKELVVKKNILSKKEAETLLSPSRLTKSQKD